MVRAVVVGLVVVLVVMVAVIAVVVVVVVATDKELTNAVCSDPRDSNDKTLPVCVAEASNASCVCDVLLVSCPSVCKSECSDIDVDVSCIVRLACELELELDDEDEDKFMYTISRTLCGGEGVIPSIARRAGVRLASV